MFIRLELEFSQDSVQVKGSAAVLGVSRMQQLGAGSLEPAFLHGTPGSTMTSAVNTEEISSLVCLLCSPL